MDLSPNPDVRTLSTRLDQVGVQVVPEGGGDPDRAVGLLVVLEQGDDRAADRDGGAVEGVEGAVALGRPDPAADAAGLVVGAVRGRGQLPVGSLGGDPGLAVELAGGRAAEVAGGDVELGVGARG